MKEQIINKAIQVLDNNFQKGGFTIPSKGLYPFQWKWDSGFIALGFAHYDIDKAKQEVETILDAQWENGFIPHIVFHNDSDTYFPGPEFHQSHLHPLASKKYRSTGMTQPPVFGFILERLYEIADDKQDMLDFINKQIDKVYDNHVYFYKNRDLNQDGLVYIYHNWESGTDNSPLWDDIWTTMNPPEYTFERRDTSHVDASQRPSKREYDHYLHIIDIAKEHNYDDAKIAELSPFLVLDPLFNAILIRSNEALINLYQQIGGHQDKIDFLKQQQLKSISGLNSKLFNEELGAYVHYDLRNDRQIPYLCSSSFAPLYSGAPDADKAKRLAETMLKRFGDEGRYLCASFDPTHDRFNPKKYWRGPVWINMNWMLYHGLRRHGINDLADRIKADSLELIEKNGFFEYFDSRKSNPDSETNGYGGNNFSWSAALLIDFLKE
ncbi:MGH1-like glycoside hydrolase domain-containing protein [Croceitalea rosinachiae]|uniref:Trehalase family glycosidase n=1 Tax=Croceitalea rosinachiae TaxID=3075596 RepID=A0ABU3A664_9FLAO|nr:trehalase family glycosidase [Croceitalea sp. F388]MDT0605459.1 trehalase family glycosidase [Croceitalea sp. F388]